MNYVYDPLPAICCCCGVELPEEPHEGEADGVCSVCFGDSQAKAAAQKELDRADEFRWLSREWFQREAKNERAWHAHNNYPGDR